MIILLFLERDDFEIIEVTVPDAVAELVLKVRVCLNKLYECEWCFTHASVLECVVDHSSLVLLLIPRFRDLERSVLLLVENQG